ncbi:NK-lysin tandem duplicate 2 precursor [Danio rerio]|uniref:NK-lysin tandem duplicate 2 n=1 Tax=Danio rerio TaxID=7955 RepID=A0A0K1H345_DANRE|nr:NK-lysin tandem duplicate 2 precursor [Danio rerio]AKT74322.1 Nk-lysin [Danio rerio]|eukprot:NP_001298721.1 NK-lysin tandem duplicate 2 precursor [Danio rerio]
MLRNIFLVSLLIYAVSAAHWEVREVDSAEDELEETPEDNMVKQKFPGKCTICKYIMNQVKKRLSTKSTPDEIKNNLMNICNKAVVLKSQCKKFIQKHIHTLIDELMNDDGPNTICTKVHACKSEPPIKEFIFIHEQAYSKL